MAEIVENIFVFFRENFFNTWTFSLKYFQARSQNKRVRDWQVFRLLFQKISMKFLTNHFAVLSFNIQLRFQVLRRAGNGDL